jgi:hypothetical protein
VLGLQGSNIPISAAGGTGDVLATVTGLPVVGDLIGGLTPTLGQLLNVSVTLDVGVPSGGGGGSTTTQPPQNVSSHFAGLKLLARTLKVGPTGRARIPVACPAAADGACRGTLSLRTVHAITAAGARMKLASARFTVPAGRTSSIPVRISRGGRRALARRHRLAARLTATARDRTNAVKSSSRTVTVLSRRR